MFLASAQPDVARGDFECDLNARAGFVAAAWSFRPLERDLSLGATRLLKGLRWGVRHAARMVEWSASWWLNWLIEAILFGMVGLASPLIDRALIRTAREQGPRGVGASLVLGLAVYVRLLVDQRSPLIGKLLLCLALVYAIADLDVIPDAMAPVGLLDDIVAVAVAGRCFMWMCPERLVQEHALKAARARDKTHLVRRS